VEEVSNLRTALNVLSQHTPPDGADYIDVDEREAGDADTQTEPAQVLVTAHQLEEHIGTLPQCTDELRLVEPAQSAGRGLACRFGSTMIETKR
jgi:hypothetical protein